MLCHTFDLPNDFGQTIQQQQQPYLTVQPCSSSKSNCRDTENLFFVYHMHKSKHEIFCCHTFIFLFLIIYFCSTICRVYFTCQSKLCLLRSLKQTFMKFLSTRQRALYKISFKILCQVQWLDVERLTIIHHNIHTHAFDLN